MVLSQTKGYPLFIVPKDKSPTSFPLWPWAGYWCTSTGSPRGRGTRIIIDDYAGRNASAGIELIVHKDKISPPDYEAKIESGGANIILLDESGTMVTSVELAEIISETSLSSRNTIFAVGPADGFSDEMKIKNKKISISRMT